MYNEGSYRGVARLLRQGFLQKNQRRDSAAKFLRPRPLPVPHPLDWGTPTVIDYILFMTFLHVCEKLASYRRNILGMQVPIVYC